VAARGPIPADAVRVAAGPVTGDVAAWARDSAETAGCGDDIKPGVSNRHRHMWPGPTRVINAIANAATNPAQRHTSS
jgi:hypothetical protein